MGASHDHALSRPSVLVGIPAYNEAGTIREVVTEAQNYADEVLVVDDGSDDETRKRVRDTGATLVTHERNRGYGATLATVFQYADDHEAAHLVVMDADGQHDAGDIPDLVATQRESGAQIVTGSRFRSQSSSGIRGYRRFGLAVINHLMNLGLRVGYSYPSISDTQCGFRVYDREAVERLANTSGVGSGMGASLDILFEAARQGYDVVEVPVEIDYDVEHPSTQNPILHGFDLLKSLFVSLARDRPLRTASAVVAVALTGILPALAIGLLGTAFVVVLVPVVLALALVLGITLSARVPPRSDPPDR